MPRSSLHEAGLPWSQVQDSCTRMPICTCSNMFRDSRAYLSAWVDARVGGRYGQAPPEAPPLVAVVLINKAKIHGPFLNCMHSQTKGIQLARGESPQLVSQALPKALTPAPPDAPARMAPNQQISIRDQCRTGPQCHMFQIAVFLLCLWWSRYALARLLLWQSALPNKRYPTRILTGVFRRRPGVTPGLRCVARQAPVCCRTIGAQSDPQPSCTEPGCLLQAVPRQTVSFDCQASEHDSPQSSAGRPRGSTLTKLLILAGTQPAASVHGIPIREYTPTLVGRPESRTAGILQAHGASAQRLTQCQKRSFKRAQVRALRDGQTSYRGRIHTPASLSLAQPYSRTLTRRKDSQAKPAQDPISGYIRVLTWNCGGLNALRYSEVLEWLRQLRQHTPVDVVCLQETRWRDCSEVTSSEWHCIHSGSGNSHAGVLFMIHRSFALQA